MPQEKDLHSCSLTSPASSSYAPHCSDPPLPEPPPHYSNSPAFEHEQRRDDGSCSSSPDCRVSTTECLFETSNFIDEEEASSSSILTGMDFSASSNDTDSLLDTMTCFSPPKQAPPPPMPPPLPPLSPSSQLPLSHIFGDSESIPLDSKSSSDCPYKEQAMLTEPQSPPIFTSLEGNEASKVALLQSPVAELSSSEHSEYTVQHTRGTTKDTTSFVALSIPAEPAYSPFHDVTDAHSSSTSEKVPYEQPLDQTALSIHLEICKGISQSEMINQVLASIDGNKSLYLVFIGVVFLSILDCF
jgi:hypothetical protein